MRSGIWVEKADYDKQQALIIALQAKVDGLQKQLDDLINTLFITSPPASADVA